MLGGCLATAIFFQSDLISVSKAIFEVLMIGRRGIAPGFPLGALPVYNQSPVNRQRCVVDRVAGALREAPLDGPSLSTPPLV